MKKNICRLVLVLSLVLTGCGKCNHQYDNGVITKESTCSEEGEKTYTCTSCEETKVEGIPVKAHEYKEEVTKESTYKKEGEKTFTCEFCNNSYTESIPALDAEAYNQNIYEQMVKLCDEEDYVNALNVGRYAEDTRDAKTKFYESVVGRDKEGRVNSTDDAKTKIDKLTREIFDKHGEYIEEQIQSAIENSDYEVLDTLHYYIGFKFQFGYQIEFNFEQEYAYQIINGLQGEYRYFENTDKNIQVEINGFNLKIGNDEYILKFSSFDLEKLAASEDFVPRVFFEKGSVERIRTGLIAITYEDGSCIKYESDAGKEWQEEQKQIKEREKQAEEKARQEYLANEPQIGMTADEVRASNWGSPDKINKTTYEWGVTEQWCYPNYKYIYFEDGIVTVIQE